MLTRLKITNGHVMWHNIFKWYQSLINGMDSPTFLSPPYNISMLKYNHLCHWATKLQVHHPLYQKRPIWRWRCYNCICNLSMFLHAIKDPIRHLMMFTIWRSIPPTLFIEEAIHLKRKMKNMKKEKRVLCLKYSFILYLTLVGPTMKG